MAAVRLFHELYDAHLQCGGIERCTGPSLSKTDHPSAREACGALGAMLVGDEQKAA